MPVETGGKVLRFRQASPKKYDKYATKKLAPGIEAVIGIPDKGGSEIQSVLFDSEKFTVAQAKKWLSDHDMKMGESGIGTPSAWTLDERLQLTVSGKVVEISEGYAARPILSALSDEDLVASRKRFCEARNALADESAGLPDSDRYTTSAGRQLLDDMSYYRRIIDTLEYEMSGRQLMLD